MNSNRGPESVTSVLDWPSNTPPHWTIDRLKWSVEGFFSGIWGDEPNGIDDIICVRVADFDRIRFKVVEAPPTLRAIEPRERINRLLRSGDLLIEKSGGGDNQPVGAVVHFDRDFEAVSSNFVARMTPAFGMYPRYWSYVHATLYAARLNLPAIKQTTGIQNLDTDAYLNQSVPFPPFAEQIAIADYLDRETSHLDALIVAKERILDLLAEKRRTLIANAVTRGLQAQTPLRDSHVSWLGEIPAHWEVERTKWLFHERDERSDSGDEELLTVSHLTGVTRRSEKDVNMFEAETTEGYKISLAGDLVINTLWAWMGAMGVSPLNGVVSPAYNVYEPGARLDPLYVDALVRMPIFAEEVIRYSKGVWSSRLRLYPEGFFEVLLPVPPINEQRSIVAYISLECSRLDRLRLATERTIALLKERRDVLIAAAVTGQILLT